MTLSPHMFLVFWVKYTALITWRLTVNSNMALASAVGLIYYHRVARQLAVRTPALLFWRSSASPSRLVMTGGEFSDHATFIFCGE